MTTDNRYNSVTVAAGADHSGAGSIYKAAAVGGTIAPSNATAVGLIRNKAKTGEGLTLAYSGECKAWAGAAIAVGARLMITTSGFCITATDSRSTVGRAMEAANSGDLFRGLFDFAAAN